MSIYWPLQEIRKWHQEAIHRAIREHAHTSAGDSADRMYPSPSPSAFTDHSHLAVHHPILVSPPTARTIKQSRPNRSPSPFPPRLNSAWIGWFPVLFYTSVYIGELHTRSSSPPSPSTKQLQLLEAEATRLGTRALLYHSLLALLANFVLPYFVTQSTGRVGNTQEGMGRFRVHLASLWAASHLLFALCMGATL
jgi:hypothetical protein